MEDSTVVEITDANFDSEVVKARTPVLLDFSAEWCGPCKKLGPIVADLAREYQGKIKVGHLDVEGSPGTAARWAIMSVPTIIFFKGGKKEEQLVGLVSRKDLESAIRKVIA